MLFIDARLSGAPGVQQVWKARSSDGGSFMSVASAHWELVVTHDTDGRATMAVRGPELNATRLDYHPGMGWWGIRFGLDCRIPALPYSSLVGSWIAIPIVDTCVERLAEPDRSEELVDVLMRRGSLVHDAALGQLLARPDRNQQPRTVQRHIQRTTGMSRRTILQIERARAAMALLRRGTTILDTVAETGYYDQAHLCRALKRWTGQTPSEHLAASTVS